MAPIESFDGGVEEFVESIPTRRLNSAFSTSNASTRATNPTTSAARSSYEGSGTSGADTTQMIDDQEPEIDSTRRSQTTNPPQQPSSTGPVNGHDCAWRHASARWLVKLDLHDFFGRISERQVYRVFEARGYSSLVSLELARICTRVDHSWVHRVRDFRYTAIPSYTVDVLGHLPQGGPSSGALANAVATPMDHVLADLAEGQRFVYTRYSDDLVFSSDGEFHREKAVALIDEVAKAVKAQGFVLHKRKTRVIPPGARHVVLGLLVDRASVRLTPEFRRRIQVHIRGVRKFGLQPHAEHRGFRSVFSFVSHVDGALAFAMDVEPEWARQTTDTWRQVLTTRGFPL